MLDVARVLIDRKEPINATAIFLFNGAEGGWCSWVFYLSRLLFLPPFSSFSFVLSSSFRVRPHD
jgi:hypothetical protein